MAADLDQVLVLASAAGALITGMVFGKGKKDNPSEAQATVLAGTILNDGKVLKDVTTGIDALKGEMKEGREQRHRDGEEERDLMAGMIRALRDNTDSVRENTLAVRNSGTTPESMAMLARIMGGGK